MKLIRYELSFCGEEQGIGFIHGIKDMGLSEKKLQNLIGKFDSDLPIPPFSTFPKQTSEGYPASFFTEEGNRAFRKEMQRIEKFLRQSDSGWELEQIEEVINEKSILYQDKYQVVLWKTYEKGVL